MLVLIFSILAGIIALLGIACVFIAVKDVLNTRRKPHCRRCGDTGNFKDWGLCPKCKEELKGFPGVEE